MTPQEPYNPLDKKNLGASVADAILKQVPVQLPPAPFNGAGVYAIYYMGNFTPYKSISTENRDEKFNWPIYVGKAVPKGGRKGGVGLSSENVGPVMYSRLQEHAESIKQASNLNIQDFLCRYLVVDDIWIPLGESLLIQRFRPVWNLYIDGFGNHDPGGGRYGQKRSPWDVLHPGRSWAMRCAENGKTDAQIRAALSKSIDDHLKQPRDGSE